jgi:nitrogen fixation/metabolism regulation signal transduction histidine kinase
MWQSRWQEYAPPSIYTRRISSFIDRNFQLRYTRRVLAIVVISSLVYAIPLFYLVNQNYNYLSRMAYRLAPNLAQHIDGEQLVFNIAVFGVIISQWILLAVFGRKMTEKIMVPLKKLRNQLRLLTRGELSMQDVRIRRDDEFQDLISTYNYYYAGLQEQTRRDMMKLLKLRDSTKHPESLKELNSMIFERATQLNVDPHDLTSTFELPAPTRDSRHAS